MSQPFVRLGDRTTHGGTVISADFSFTMDGKAVARVGDLTVCPRCKGIFPINDGLNNTISMGQAMAVHMAGTACGAKVVASFATAVGEDTNGAAEPIPSVTENALVAGSAAVAARAPTICLECLAQAATAGSAMVVRG